MLLATTRLVAVAASGDGSGGRCDRMEANAARLEAAVRRVDVPRGIPGLWVSEE